MLFGSVCCVRILACYCGIHVFLFILEWDVSVFVLVLALDFEVFLVEWPGCSCGLYCRVTVFYTEKNYVS